MTGRDPSTGEDTAVDAQEIVNLQITGNVFYGDSIAPFTATVGRAIRAVNITASSAATSTISDNTIDRVAQGIEVFTATDLAIEGNTITNVTNGIHLDSEDTDNLIDNNDITNSSGFGQGDNGILLNGGPNDTASNNYVENFLQGIQVLLDSGDNGMRYPQKVCKQSGGVPSV